MLEKLRRKLPFALRTEGLRLLRFIRDRREKTAFAKKRGDAGDFPHVLAQASSPLHRGENKADTKLQLGKENNVRLAAGFINGLVLHPGQCFSYHRMVKRPSRLRGFQPGLELRRNQMASGIGGGCCQVSNQLYWLAINSGMHIVERHRHGFDLFPDAERTVPFGCGATVFYNYRDLRFANPLTSPVLIQIAVVDNQLWGQILSSEDPGLHIKIEEREHRFFAQRSEKMRENKIFRLYLDAHGEVEREEMLAHNRCRVLY